MHHAFHQNWNSNHHLNMHHVSHQSLNINYHLNERQFDMSTDYFDYFVYDPNAFTPCGGCADATGRKGADSRFVEERGYYLAGGRNYGINGRGRGGRDTGGTIFTDLDKHGQHGGRH